MSKRCFCTLLTLAVVVMTTASFAQGVYSNGPINGSTDAWTINFGFVVSNTFTVSSSASFNTFWFGAWTFPGDVLLNAEVQITSAEFGGTTYFDGIATFTQSNCSANQYGFNVCLESGSWNSAVNLAAGTYWLNLDNAVVNDGDPIYWDENSGASRASENTVGTIPSEAFTVGGCCGPPPPSVPEPGSLMLLLSGIMGAAPLLARKLR